MHFTVFLSKDDDDDDDCVRWGGGAGDGGEGEEEGGWLRSWVKYFVKHSNGTNS